MDRLIAHLGLVAYDFPEDKQSISEALDHPGVFIYNFHESQTAHAQYQGHLRHPIPLGAQYQQLGSPELFLVIVDLRQEPHSGCWHPACAERC